VSNLIQVRTFLGTELGRISLDEIQANRIILAVDEACANAVIHGNKNNQHLTIHIDITLDNKLVEIEIYDIGQFDKESSRMVNGSCFHSYFDVQKNIISRKKGGLGLCLIYKLMDEVNFYERNKISVCCLKKYLT
jgi:serine/threonine-protein kinase RsbW